MKKTFILLSLLASFTACEKEEVAPKVETIKNTPPTDITLDKASITEREPAGALIGTLASIDENADDQAVFSIITGGEYFKVNNNQLVTRAPLDFEERPIHNITVLVNDGAGGVYNKDFTIDVLNIDDNYLIGSWRHQGTSSWYQFTFNEDLTGIRTSSYNENDEFTYTYTDKEFKFTSGFEPAEFEYKIDGNTLTLFGDEFVKQ